MTVRMVLTVLPARPARKARLVLMVRKVLQVPRGRTALSGALARAFRTTAQVWTVTSGSMSMRATCTSARQARTLWSTISKALKALPVRKALLV
jgi:hypothetical protein